MFETGLKKGENGMAKARFAAKKVEVVARAICSAERMNEDDSRGGWVLWKAAAISVLAALEEQRSPDQRRKSVRCNITIPNNVLAQIDVFCKKDGITRSWFLVRAATEFLASVF